MSQSIIETYFPGKIRNSSNRVLNVVRMVMVQSTETSGICF